MLCQQCEQLGHPIRAEGKWLCCGQLHCAHILKCPSCGAVVPHIPMYVISQLQDEYVTPSTK